MELAIPGKWVRFPGLLVYKMYACITKSLWIKVFAEMAYIVVILLYRLYENQ
jgi:hypothetical protein